MAEYWRRRPRTQAVQFTGDLVALAAWVAEIVTDLGCSILNNVTVEADWDGVGFVVFWDEGYLGAETMRAEGTLNQWLVVESCWFRSVDPDEFTATYEPVV